MSAAPFGRIFTLARVACSWSLLAVAVGLFAVSSRVSYADDNEQAAEDAGDDGDKPKGFDTVSLDWVSGPAKAPVGGEAEIDLPEGYAFTGPAGCQKLLQMMENPTDGSELGFLCKKGSTDWFVVFEFDGCGYVKDDEKSNLDANEILSSIRKGTEASNEERKKRGWGTISVLGWLQAPHYDDATNHLVWATRASSSDSGGETTNYNTRVLGRGGVMSVNLVADAADLPKLLPELKTLLAGFHYVDGRRYADFKSGDKIAEYGLTALIAGGGLAAAAKFGLLKKFWKLIVVAVAGVAAAFRKLVGKLRGETAS